MRPYDTRIMYRPVSIQSSDAHLDDVSRRVLEQQRKTGRRSHPASTAQHRRVSTLRTGQTGRGLRETSYRSLAAATGSNGTVQSAVTSLSSTATGATETGSTGGASDPVQKLTRRIRGRQWHLGIPLEGNGTQFGFAYAANSPGPGRKGQITLPNRTVEADEVQTLLREQTGAGFWPEGGTQQDAILEELAQWIVEERQAIKDQGQDVSNPHQQQPLSLVEQSARVETQERVYSNKNPGHGMDPSVKDKRVDWGGLTWQASTANARTVHIGWKRFGSDEESAWTTDTLELDETVEYRQEVTRLLPRQDDTKFWSESEFGGPMTDSAHQWIAGRLITLISDVREMCGAPALKQAPRKKTR